MEDKKYEEFFQEIKEFLAEQKLQRLRGLNDYNILKVVRNSNEEVGLHSRFLHSFLDINGEHYQNDLFVNIFIKNVLKLNDFGRVLRVKREDLTDKNRRIDFTIKSEKYFIGIEMKIDADDQEQQIYDYHKFLEGIKTDNQKVIIYYLTKYGVEASEKSYIKGDEKIEYKQISFNEDILKWIEECQKEVKNITNLNYALEEYKEIVKIIINKKKENVISLAEKIATTSKLFEAFKKLINDENITKLSEPLVKDIKQISYKVYELQWKLFLDKFTNEIKDNYQYLRIDDKSLDIILNDEFIVRIMKTKSEYKDIKLQVANRVNSFGYDINKQIVDEIRKKLEKVKDAILIKNYNRYYGYFEIREDKEKIKTLIEEIKEILCPTKQP